MRNLFIHGLQGHCFGLDEVRFTESMDRFVAIELVYKMCSLHYISDSDAKILANHNVPRIVGLYQSLICEQGDADHYMSDFVKYGYSNRNESTEIDAVLTEFEEMKLNEKDII